MTRVRRKYVHSPGWKPKYTPEEKYARRRAKAILKYWTDPEKGRQVSREGARRHAAKPGVIGAKRREGRDRTKKDKLRAFAVLGDACLRCGFDDPRALCFDHVANDGVAHRALGLFNMARWVIANPAEACQRIQVLCANCNLIKEVDRKVALRKAA